MIEDVRKNTIYISNIKVAESNNDLFLELNKIN